MRNGILIAAAAASAAVSTSSSASSSPSAVRGGGGVATTTTIDGSTSGTNTKKKRTRHDITNSRRPGVVDADQSNKIRLWREQWLASSRGRAAVTHGADETAMEEEGGVLPPATTSRRRRLGTKSSNIIGASRFGNISVEAAPVDILGFQEPPPPPNDDNGNEGADDDGAVADTPSSEITARTPSATSTSAATSTAAATTVTPVANRYYPLFLFDYTKGTCTNNGHEPSEYADTPESASNYMFDTKAECCGQWYVDAKGCLYGFAYPDVGSSGMLLRRDEMGNVLPNAPPPMKVEDDDDVPAAAAAVVPAVVIPDDVEVDVDVVDEGSTGGGEGGKLVGAQPLMMGGGGGGGVGGGEGSNNENKYYPSLDMKKYPNGACPNDGNIPLEYQRDLSSSSSSEFIFDSIEECCVKWFIDVEACIAATTATTATADDAVADEEIADLDAMMANAAGATINTYVPSPYPTFIEDEEELEDTDETPWPTWSDAFVADDTDEEKQSAAETFVNGGKIKGGEEEEESTATTTTTTSTRMPPPESTKSKDKSSYLLHESFESGDFTKYDWSLPTYPKAQDNSMDTKNILTWEADLTSVAYDGEYAARAGMLTTPGSMSNLTLVLEGMDVSQGGLLTYAVHAAVEMPIDVLYFTINSQIIRTYNKVSGNSGEWEQESILLLPGKHTLTWSYQYFGLPEEGSALYDPMYAMDPRRVGNTWIDDIAFEGFTGDVTLPDSGNDAKAILLSNNSSPSSSSWKLIIDPDAYLGSHSYIAYTQDIKSNKGSAVISWNIIAGSSGGILSFAIFGSVYAPHDVLEFSVDNIPQVVISVPSDEWDIRYIEIEAGKHVVTWKLVKNVASLSQDILKDVGTPDNYQGYAKIDAIMFENNQVYTTSTTTTSTAATSTTTTTTMTTEATTTEAITTTTEAPVEVITTTEIPPPPDDDEEDIPPPPDDDVAATTTENPPHPDDDVKEVTAIETIPMDEGTSTTFATFAIPEPPTDDTVKDDTSVSEPESPAMEELKSEVTTIGSVTVNNDTIPVLAGGCPEGLVSVDGLPNCCVEDPLYLGDGACDPRAPYNTEECAFDLGDCCYESCNQETAYGCLTVDGNIDEVGPFGFFCLDPRYSIIDEVKCVVENREWIGDGGCDVDGGYNTEECKQSLYDVAGILIIAYSFSSH